MLFRRKSKWDIPADAVANSNGNSSSNSAAEAAKERAAKLTAMLAAKGKLANNTGSILPVVKNYYYYSVLNSSSHPSSLSGVLLRWSFFLASVLTFSFLFVFILPFSFPNLSLSIFHSPCHSSTQPHIIFHFPFRPSFSFQLTFHFSSCFLFPSCFCHSYDFYQFLLICPYLYLHENNPTQSFLHY